MNKNGKHGARYGTKEKETKKFFGRISFRTFALSLVALIQIALLLVGATYSWVETISSIKFEGAKGNIETAVKKLVNISDNGGTISLDNYFREAGDVHLAACSSADGENFYFPIIGETNKYREGTINDKNVNYIDFDFEIKNTTETEKQYTFNTVPNVEDDVRVAIYLENSQPQIFAKNASTEKVVSFTEPNLSSNDGMSVQTVKKFEGYTHGNTDGNSIFKVLPGGEVKVKVKIWLQEGGSSTSNTVSINDLALICGESQKTVTVKYGKDCDSSMGDIYLNNDKKLSKAFCAEGSTVTLCSDANTNSTDIAPYGYKFMGWFDDYECTVPATDLNEKNVFTMKKSSKEYYAKFKKSCEVKVVVTQTRPDKKTYLGSVTLDGKTGVSLSTQKYACGETVNFSVSPIAGYEFVGWYSTSDFVGDSLGKESPKSVKLSEDKTSYIYYAKFLPKEVTVKATVKDKIGGVINFGDETKTKIEAKVNYDSSITFYAKAYTGEGYVFDGWYEDSECSKIISNETRCTVDVNKEEQLNGVQIYAKFRLKQYKIKLNATSFYNNTKIEDTNKKYGKVSYTIDDGTQADADTSKEFNVEYGKELVLNAEPGEYCDFDGWYSDKDLETKITDNVNYTPTLSGDDGKTFSYYAKFSIKSKKFSVGVPKAYSELGKVNIDNNEGVTSGTFKYGDEVTLTAKANENYKFVGWYTDSNCTGDPIKDINNNVVGENYRFTVDNSTSDYYYAKFEIKTKTISVSCKNDTGDTTSSVKIMLGTEDKGASGTFNYGETITLVASSGSNYEVKAWYMDADCNQMVSSSEGETELSLTVGDSTSETYYVKLVKKAKHISVSCKPDNQYGTSTAVIDNGTPQGTTTYSCEYGSEITLVATPDDKHTFVGWYSDSNCEGSAISTSSSYDITVDNNTKDNYYAKFEVQPTRTIYYYNSNTNWTNIHFRAWEDQGDSWEYPGKKATNVRSNYWSYNVPESYNRIIFNNGNPTDKTGIITVPTDNNLCYDSRVGAWTTVPPEGTHRIIVSNGTNDPNWNDNVYCYAWGSEGTMPSDPDKLDKKGKEMKKITGVQHGENDIYYIDIDNKYTNVLFTNGSFGDYNQTVDKTDSGTNDITCKIVSELEGKKYKLSDW